MYLLEFVTFDSILCALIVLLVLHRVFVRFFPEPMRRKSEPLRRFGEDET